MEGLKKGNAVLGDLQREMSLDEVEKLMSDTAEAIAYQNVFILFALKSRVVFLVGNFGHAGK